MRTTRTARGAALAAALAALTLLAGCATAGHERTAGTAGGGGWLDGEPSRERAATGAAGGSEAMTSDARVAAPAPGSAVPPDTPVSSSQASAALRAGSVDDNERFEDYLLYRDDALRSGIHVHDVDVRGRKIVSVRNRTGRPVVGATVRLLDGVNVVGEAKTHADGRAFLFPPARVSNGQQSAAPVRVAVERDGVRAEAPVTGAVDVPITLAVADPVPPALDVMFVIDATGSMGDEIEQLKANVISISDRLAELPGAPDVRFATTVFRDRGDAFVTRTFDFTPDVHAFQGALRAVVADGGGDTPESVNAALHDAIHKPSWRGGQTVSLAFLVGDAAPHLDYPDDADYAVEVFEAAKRGIEIEPIASSGLDDQGEFVFRQLAQLTGGRFSFLTYGAGGAPEPGDTTTHHVHDYSVLSLDDLVVRLVSEELSPLTRPASGSGQL
jgi:hypothetical protein